MDIMINLGLHGCTKDGPCDKPFGVRFMRIK